MRGRPRNKRNQVNIDADSVNVSLRQMNESIKISNTNKILLTKYLNVVNMIHLKELLQKKTVIKFFLFEFLSTTTITNRKCFVL